MARLAHESTIFLLLLVACTVGLSYGQHTDRICASSRFSEQCLQLQRGNSEVVCVTVQDSIECAQRLRNRTADIGVFSAESLLHLATLGWDGMAVVKELRHNERHREPFDFRSVVVVSAQHRNGLEGLRGSKFCHPGFHYGRQHRWSEHFLKYFERLVVPTQCHDLPSAAEIETAGVSNFFHSACRPGRWSHVPQEDSELKSKYSNLCALCPNPNQCTYDTSTTSNHLAALNCLRSGGNVAYVSREEAFTFFESNADIASDYSFLCPNGTLEAISGNSNPCTWLRQPWPVVMSSAVRSVEISAGLERWMRGDSQWEQALREIITQGSVSPMPVASIQQPVDYLRTNRPIPIANDLCQTTARLCTTSPEEYEKCVVLSTAALTSGVYPMIECTNPTTNRMSCMNEIAFNRADFMGIDSNFGYLARHPFNLTAAMYQETEKEKYSSVAVLVKDDQRFQRFENLRNAKACIPEFGGIASIAFINVGKARGIFDRRECNYGQLLGSFFSETCAPGSRDNLHDPSGTNPESLCSLCRPLPTDPMPFTEVPIAPADAELEDTPIEGDEPVAHIQESNVNVNLTRNPNCAANENNPFYGTRGALNCLKLQGDIAVVEVQNLAEHARSLNIDPSTLRILCRNGSLAAEPGFRVDEDCYLTTIVDGEIVVRRQYPGTLSLVNALSSLDLYLQHDPDFRMYNIFGGVKNLLFEDSALGLVSTRHDELGQSVQNYIKLFENIEDCSSSARPTSTPSPLGDGAVVLTINVFMTFLFAAYNIIAHRQA